MLVSVPNIHFLLKNLVQSYKSGDRANLKTMEEKCRVQTAGKDFIYNFDLLQPSGYANTIFEADAYEAKVGWVSYKKSTQKVYNEELDEYGKPLAKNEIIATEGQSEEKRFLALVLKRHIYRSRHELKLAKKQGKSLSTEFSCDIPVGLIPRVYTAFAKIYMLQGGVVSDDYPEPTTE